MNVQEDKERCYRSLAEEVKTILESNEEITEKNLRDAIDRSSEFNIKDNEGLLKINMKKYPNIMKYFSWKEEIVCGWKNKFFNLEGEFSWSLWYGSDFVKLELKNTYESIEDMVLSIIWGKRGTKDFEWDEECDELVETIDKEINALQNEVESQVKEQVEYFENMVFWMEDYCKDNNIELKDKGIY